MAPEHAARIELAFYPQALAWSSCKLLPRCSAGRNNRACPPPRDRRIAIRPPRQCRQRQAANYLPSLLPPPRPRRGRRDPERPQRGIIHPVRALLAPPLLVVLVAELRGLRDAASSLRVKREGAEAPRTAQDSARRSQTEHNSADARHLNAPLRPPTASSEGAASCRSSAEARAASVRSRELRGWVFGSVAGHQ